MRTSYLLGSDLVPSLFSNIVNVTVALGIPRIISRKTHGTSGTYDIDLPLTGTAGIECRKGGGASSNTHQIIFQFGSPVTFTGANATSDASKPGSTGQVTSTSGNGTKEVVVNLGSVSDIQTLSLSLTGVSSAGTASTLNVPMGILLGDTNGNSVVNGTDSAQTQSQSGKAVTASNFRTDVNTNGAINATDSALVQSRSGDFLPP